MYQSFIHIKYQSILLPVRNFLRKLWYNITTIKLAPIILIEYLSFIWLSSHKGVNIIMRLKHIIEQRNLRIFNIFQYFHFFLSKLGLINTTAPIMNTYGVKYVLNTSITAYKPPIFLYNIIAITITIILLLLILYMSYILVMSMVMTMVMP